MIFEQVLKNIGGRIKEIRENKGMSQQSLADACNFEKSNMSRIEAGRTNLTVRTLFTRSARPLRVKIADLLDTN
jgi:transcriptional regulator with XRE-family HTH domain